MEEKTQKRLFEFEESNGEDLLIPLENFFLKEDKIS